MMQAGRLYRQIRDRFRGAEISDPELDAKLLVSTLLGIGLSDLLLNDAQEVDAAQVREIEEKAVLRMGGMPLGRILGEREFYGRRFLLNSATLEPRPDTETLIDAVLSRTAGDAPVTIWDIGTGSGAIAVTLLAERPRGRAIAIDLSEDALACAVNNARLHSVEDRFHPICADYLAAMDLDRTEGPDWIVSNPPYICSRVLEELSPEVIDHDPRLALDGGENGLNAYAALVPQAAGLLRSGARIALEIGYDQAASVEKLLRQHDLGEIEIIKDLAGNDRVALARGT
ncbi:peptide chain release factor N(5)-glutamine methyltransferase [Roseibium sp. MMSF_3412]|uniref:peptide chain release factor N(5)-glutamine methyltransferase n=1 Tax=Roseibium sp. MMSF_3412 TaxID=3046712 RepID=UPI00273F8C45|nr:peptide chain release factor N(5)-glutamine methyltransferase [Roseibium sp. MMSF_3412]